MASLGDFITTFALVHTPLPPFYASQRSRMPAEVTENTKNQVISTFLDHPRFICAHCSAVLALQDELVSKSFTGREGRGFLLNTAVNVKLGRKEDRPLLTGVHTVADVFCLGCNDCIGWYYYKASDQSQKYKEGKYLLEREKLVKENNWKLDQ